MESLGEFLPFGVLIIIYGVIIYRNYKRKQQKEAAAKAATASRPIRHRAYSAAAPQPAEPRRVRTTSPRPAPAAVRQPDPVLPDEGVRVTATADPLPTTAAPTGQQPDERRRRLRRELLIGEILARKF